MAAVTCTNEEFVRVHPDRRAEQCMIVWFESGRKRYAVLTGAGIRAARAP